MQRDPQGGSAPAENRTASLPESVPTIAKASLRVLAPRSLPAACRFVEPHDPPPLGVDPYLAHGTDGKTRAITVSAAAVSVASVGRAPA
jgi:hypothetical protein